MLANRLHVSDHRIRAADVAEVVFLASLLLWPLWVNGGALLFHDSAGYVSGGEHAWRFIADVFRRSGEAGGGGGARALPEAGGVRSIAYSVFVWPLHAVAGRPFMIAVAQAVIVAGLLRALIDDLPPAARAAVVVVAIATPLPIFVCYVTPDVFAGVAMLVALLVVSRGGTLGRGEALLLTALGGFAAAAHLSHPPLYLALGVAGAAALLLRRELRPLPALALLAPPFIALAVNLLGSAIAFDEPSVTPKRPPVIIARALADGPARRHVEAACAEDPDVYALCEIIDRLPEDSGAILFGPDGFRSAEAPDFSERLRREEPAILARAAASEPFAQLAALIANAARQSWTFGMADVGWSDLEIDADGEWREDLGLHRDRAAWRALETLHLGVVVAALAGLAVAARRDRLTAAADERGLLLALAAGLAANALICGGLSAPADRYQARVIWALPVLVALFTARRLSRPARRPVRPS